MRILAMDCPRDLEGLLNLLGPEAEFFPEGASLLDRAAKGFDAIFLGDVPGRLALARDLRRLAPRGNLIFVSSSEADMGEAFRLHASGYLVKPVTKEQVKAVLADLRYPVPGGKLRVQTFGNFEAFCGEEPVRFARQRTKELFAYLIDRQGAGSTMGELISILWEGRPATESVHSQLRNLICDLRRTLEKIGQGKVIRKGRDFIAVDPGQVDCDYYRFLAGDPAAVKAFRGEYMSNYSWAEATVGALER
jgi:two-component SAPR family response regulator